MDEGSREHSPKAQDDMDVRDNPEVQMSESTDQSLTPGNGPKAVFATGAAKKAKKKNKKNKTPAEDPLAEEVIAEEYECRGGVTANAMDRLKVGTNTR